MRQITFYSTKTCPNCRIMKTWVNDLHLNVEYITLDYDSPEIDTLNIQSVPTIIISEKGAEVARLTGSHSKAQLDAFFKQNM